MSLHMSIVALSLCYTLTLADILESKTLLVGEPIVNGPYDIDASDLLQASEPVSDIMARGISQDALSADLQQSILSLGHNGVGLMSIMDSAVDSTAIFGQVLRYMTTPMGEAVCDWTTQINGIMGSDERGWHYLKSAQSNRENLEIDPAVDILDSLAQIQGKDDLNCAWCHDLDYMPEELREQLDVLWQADGTRTNQKLAILKYTAWKIGGIVWHDDFMAQMGFEDDHQLMESMMFSLEDLLLSTEDHLEDPETNQTMTLNDTASECDLLDPVELINTHYTNTIRELSSVFAEWNELGVSPEVTIALSFGANVGGGIGFAVNGHGETMLYSTVRSPLSMTNRPVVPEQGASLVVTVGIHEDLQSVQGFGTVNNVGDAFPQLIFPSRVFAAMSENADQQWIVNGVIFEASFDPIESEYRFGYEIEMPSYSRWNIPIASLVSTKCALETQGVDINEWKEQYPMIQPLAIELSDDEECGITVMTESASNSIRILEAEPRGLPQRRKVKNPETKTHGMITLLFMGLFLVGLVYIGLKIDWVYLINGGRSEQVTFLDGEQRRPLITKSEETPEIVIY